MKKPGKHVWFGGIKWRVENHIKPNKCQDFLLLSRNLKTVEEDGSPSVDMVVIDCRNDTFVPDTKKTRTMMKQGEEHRKVLEELRRDENDLWLTMFKDEW